jgi:hypothetical protein
MKFDRTNLRQIRADILLALSKVEQTHGITITLGVGRFSPSEYRTKVTCSTVATVDEATKARKEFEELAGAFHLRADDFGKTFKNPYGGPDVTIVAIKPRSTKYPIIVQTARGARYKFQVSHVLRGLGRTTEAEKIAKRETSFLAPGFHNRHED